MAVLDSWLPSDGWYWGLMLLWPWKLGIQ